MLRFYSILIGENPSYTSKFHPAGQRKIALYGTVILIPVMLWLLNGFLLSYQIIKAGIAISIITGLVAAVLVFLVERAIIMSNGSKVIMVFRLCLGFLIASIGAIAVDQALFKEDIDLKIAEYRQSFVRNLVDSELMDQKSEISTLDAMASKKRDDWMAALNEATGECDGTKGSRIPNRGPVCNIKLAIAAKMETDYKNELDKLNNLKNEYQAKVRIAKAEAGNAFSEKGLLIRMEALSALIQEKPAVRKVFWGFTLLFFFLEFMVVLIKVFSHDSIDELLEKERDKEHQRKLKELLIRNEEYRSHHEIMDRLVQVRNTFPGNGNNIFN